MRPVLIACNVVLATDDLRVAGAIAASIRESSGTANALPGIRALGFRLHGRGLVQVSTNIERWADAGPADVLDAVHRLAAANDVPVLETELVGLAPEDALGPLRDRCSALGVTLCAARSPSLEDAMRQA